MAKAWLRYLFFLAPPEQLVAYFVLVGAASQDRRERKGGPPS